MAQVIKDVVTWLKQWFYTESEIDTITGGLQTQINNKADSTTVSSLSTTVSGKADKTGGVAQITDANAHTYIDTSANDSQATINTAIDTAIGNLQSIKAIVVVSTLPTASVSTMGKLYIISENSKVNVYYTERIAGEFTPSYSWHKMDADILDELVVNWSDVQGKPTIPSKTSDLTNDGADGTNVFVANNDSRLSDARTPTSHTHGQVTNDGKITSTAVTVASGDNIVITDASDSSKVKRVANLLASHIKDGTAHSNIGSSESATQATINTSIDTVLGNKISKSSTSGLVKNDGSIDTSTYITSSAISGKSDKTATIGTTITLVDKGETNEGCIIFNTIS